MIALLATVSRGLSMCNHMKHAKCSSIERVR